MKPFLALLALAWSVTVHGQTFVNYKVTAFPNTAPGVYTATTNFTIPTNVLAKIVTAYSTPAVTGLNVSIVHPGLPAIPADVANGDPIIGSQILGPADVRTMFNFAVRRGLVGHNPANAVELPAFDPPPPSIHTPGQVTAVLEFARDWDLNLCRCLAVRYFAGLRSSEADRLREDQIKAGHVEVTAANAKTRKRRLVTVQPALRSWLDLGGSLNFGDRSNRWRLFVAAMTGKTGVPWPHNVTRHCFVSYHLAEWRNAAETALEAGHTEQMLFAHYREIVTKEAAAQFWKILPS